ncbi:hypothetical protein D3C74_320050 [compost metagenome]
MKLKKVLTILLTSVMLLTVSSSVFAADVSPTAIGVGDTKETAITLFAPLQEIELFLSNINDKDWFKWTNNTGEDTYIYAQMIPRGNQCRFRLGMEVSYANGKNSTILYAREYPLGESQVLAFMIPKGATAYFVVDSTQYAMEGYKFQFRTDL